VDVIQLKRWLGFDGGGGKQHTWGGKEGGDSDSGKYINSLKWGRDTILKVNERRGTQFERIPSGDCTRGKLPWGGLGGAGSKLDLESKRGSWGRHFEESPLSSE